MAHVNKLLTALVTAIIATTVTADIPSCDGLLEGTMLRTEDCTGWYRCVHGVAQKKPSCETDKVFSMLAYTCVARGSVYDDCPYTPPGPCFDLPEGAILPHDDDCTGWSMCSNGVAIVMPACGMGLVFSRSENTCVHKSGVYDDCTQTVQERCDAGASLIPHATECQLYYNCSKAEEWKGEARLSECIYPNQFNSDTLTCDDFENVQCRGRKHIKEYCGYTANKCTSKYCNRMPPCNVFSPSCLGLLDGVNVYQDREWSPFYARCYKERLVETGKCPNEDGTQLFHRYLRECVPLDMIPQANGGTMPDCSGLPDGLHADDLGRCDQYTVCEDETAVETIKCDDGLAFDTGLVFSRSESTCVQVGGVYDDCTQTVQERCDAGAGLIPHATECQLYYNCSKSEEWKGEAHLSECLYPNQFNSDTLTCDEFENVQCRGRKDIKEYCGYTANERYYKATPCHVNNPSCLGLLDGDNVYQHRKWSPYYAICYKERLVETGECPNDDGTPFFHPDLRECVPRDMIPQKNGGTMPDCSGLSDGLHADYLGRCDQYTVCKDGKAENTIKCDGGFVFDSHTELCVPFEVSCTPPPCGNPETCSSMSNTDP